MKQHLKNTNGQPSPRNARLRPAGQTTYRRANRPSVQTSKLDVSTHTIKRPHNYAFIDSQNVNRSVRAQGWQLDWKQFRRYLQTQQDVTKALLFIGFIEANQPLYDELKKAGFTVVFKPTVEIHKDGETTVKGNVDTDLVLHAMIERDHYDRAVIVSGDGDFHSLAKHLEGQGKLQTMLVPSSRRYSTLLNDFEEKIVAMDEMRGELQVK